MSSPSTGQYDPGGTVVFPVISSTDTPPTSGVYAVKTELLAGQKYLLGSQPPELDAHQGGDVLVPPSWQIALNTALVLITDAAPQGWSLTPDATPDASSFSLTISSDAKACFVNLSYDAGRIFDGKYLQYFDSSTDNFVGQASDFYTGPGVPPITINPPSPYVVATDTNTALPHRCYIEYFAQINGATYTFSSTVEFNLSVFPGHGPAFCVAAHWDFKDTSDRSYTVGDTPNTDILLTPAILDQATCSPALYGGIGFGGAFLYSFGVTGTPPAPGMLIFQDIDPVPAAITNLGPSLLGLSPSQIQDFGAGFIIPALSATSVSTTSAYSPDTVYTILTISVHHFFTQLYYYKLICDYRSPLYSLCAGQTKPVHYRLRVDYFRSGNSTSSFSYSYYASPLIYDDGPKYLNLTFQWYPCGTIPPPPEQPAIRSRSNLSAPTQTYCRAESGSQEGVFFWSSYTPVPRVTTAPRSSALTYWQNEATAVTTNPDDTSPTLAVDSRNLLYCGYSRASTAILSTPPVSSDGIFIKRSDDGGATWNTESMAITGGMAPVIATKAGALLVGATTGNDTDGYQLQFAYKGPGDSTFGTQYVAQDATMTPLAVDKSGFDVCGAQEGPDRWVLTVLIAGESATSEWWSADNGKSWVRIPTS